MPRLPARRLSVAVNVPLLDQQQCGSDAHKVRLRGTDARQRSPVLDGTAEGGLRWLVVVSGDSEDLYTMLRVYSGDELVVPGSGFGGPPLYPGSVLNEWAAGPPTGR